MNEASYGGWVPEAYNEKIIEAARYDVDRINADEAAANILAEAGWDAGFVAGAEAQKNGLAYA